MKLQKGLRWEVLFRIQLNWAVILPLPLASRLKMFSHTTEAAFFTAMLIPLASPAMVMPLCHTGTKNRALHSITDKPC